jgi:hypothetical protein
VLGAAVVADPQSTALKEPGQFTDGCGSVIRDGRPTHQPCNRGGLSCLAGPVREDDARACVRQGVGDAGPMRCGPPFFRQAARTGHGNQDIVAADAGVVEDGGGAFPLCGADGNAEPAVGVRHIHAEGGQHHQLLQRHVYWTVLPGQKTVVRTVPYAPAAGPDPQWRITRKGHSSGGAGGPEIDNGVVPGASDPRHGRNPAAE